MELLQFCVKPLKYTVNLVQHCGNSSALAMELLQFCVKPLKYTVNLVQHW